MDAIILTAFLRTILTVTTVWNTVETGDIDTGMKFSSEYMLSNVIKGSVYLYNISLKT